MKILHVFIKVQIGNQTNLGILWNNVRNEYSCELCVSYVAIMVSTTKKGDTIHPSIWILRKKERKKERFVDPKRGWKGWNTKLEGLKHNNCNSIHKLKVRNNSKVENEIEYTKARVIKFWGEITIQIFWPWDEILTYMHIYPGVLKPTYE